MESATATDAEMSQQRPPPHPLYKTLEISSEIVDRSDGSGVLVVARDRGADGSVGGRMRVRSRLRSQALRLQAGAVGFPIDPARRKPSSRSRLAWGRCGS